MNEVTPKECSEKSRDVPAVSRMSPRVRGMVPIIFGKWLPFMVSGYSDWKVPESFGRVRKFPGFRKNHEWKGQLVGPAWQVGHAAPLSGSAKIGGGRSPSGTPTPPLKPNWGGKESN